MRETQALGDCALLLRRRTGTAVWVFVWCLLVHGGGAPAYSQADSARPPRSVPSGNQFRISIVGVTNTQAVLAYTAPDSGACTVKVSQQASLTPLVRDVDPALFPGSDQDTRPETAIAQTSAPTSRIFVVGKRIAQTASDGKNYSRALETYAAHYYQVTCGSAVRTGMFTTANIPLGMTYNEVPQVDPSNPGQWMIPTQLQDRTQTIVDSQTGALLKRVSLDAEAGNHSYGYAGAFLTYGGFNRVCSAAVTGPSPSKRGYLCVFPDYGLEYGLLYFIVPATGETLYLGMISHVGVSVNGSDLSLYYGSGANIYRSTYTGNFRPVINQEGIATSPDVVYSATSMNQLMQEFDPSFDGSLYACSAGIPGPGQYALIQCNRSVQDSYGWIGAFYGGDGRPIAANCTAGDACPRVVAAMNVLSAPATRWCALHNIQMIPGNPLVGLNFQQLHDFSGGLGAAPMATKLSTAIAPGDGTITVDGEPVSLATAGDPVRQAAAVGDAFIIGANPTESVRITAITQLPNGQRAWTVSRDSQAKAFPAGTVVWADCKAGFRLTYWKFLNDPHGQDTTNHDVVIDSYWDGGGHADAGPLGRITEFGSGWAVVFGRVIDHLNEPLSLVIDDSPRFAGAQGFDYGSTTSKHPSYHQDEAQTPALEQRWFLDMLAFDGGTFYSANPGATLLSGQLYKYIPATGAPLARKQLATIASSGGSSLLDISGPGSRLSDQPSDAYKYCVATVAGECRAGSAPGDILINAPNLKYLYCTGGDGPNPTNKDLCVGNAGSWAQGMTQVYMGDSLGDSVSHSRVVTHGLAGIKNMFYYSTAKSLPDASWALFNVGVVMGTPADQVNVWMAKLPPLSKQDAVDRSTFVRAPLSISAPEGQPIASAAVEFGYTEQGESSQYYCTSRREACVAVSATVNDAAPFYYSQTETYTRMPCAKSCTITLPVLPAHVAYYQVKFYDDQGVLVRLGDRGVSVEGTVAKPGGDPASARQ
jgi:hypothetical protein